MYSSPREPRTVLQLLAKVAANLTNDLESYSMEHLESDTDEETDYSTPTLHSSYPSGGASAIMNICTSRPTSIKKFWMKFMDMALENWDTERGKTKDGAKDMLLVVLSCMKRGGQLDFLGRMFKIMGPSLKDLVDTFIRLAADVKTQNIGASHLSGLAHGAHHQKQPGIQKLSLCRIRSGFYFLPHQHTYKKSPKIENYFSEKHKLYVDNSIEVSVMPVGPLIACSVHFVRISADIGMFYSMTSEHELMLKKRKGDDDNFDAGALCEKCPES